MRDPNARFVSAAEAYSLAPGDRMLGLARNGVVSAYSIAILNWHQIVNDHLGDQPVVITYWPRCGTSMAGVTEGTEWWLSFGVSDLLYNSNMLLYDNDPQLLWSQNDAHAISGPHQARCLNTVLISQTT